MLPSAGSIDCLYGSSALARGTWELPRSLMGQEGSGVIERESQDGKKAFQIGERAVKSAAPTV